MNVWGQNIKLKVSGKVTDCNQKTAIKNVTIKLFCQDGSSDSTKTDTSGNYIFNSKILKPNLLYVVMPYYPNNKKNTGFGKCPFSYNTENRYMNSLEKKSFSAKNFNPNKQYDFCLSPYSPELKIHDIFFKKNSIEYETENINYKDYDMRGDTTLDCWVDLIKNYSNWTFEIAGYADSTEINYADLSYKRAKKVYYIILANDIEKERVSYKGYGFTNQMQAYSYSGNNNKLVSLYISRKNYINSNKKGVKLIDRSK